MPLERIEPFQKFNDFLHTYNLFRGKTKESEESAVVGEFKGTFRVYDLPGDPNVALPPRAMRGLPATSSEDVIVRVYVIRANDLAPKDPNGLVCALAPPLILDVAMAVVFASPGG